MAIDTLGANALASDSVTTAKISDGSIATADIADDAVTSAKLDTNIAVAGTLGVTGLTTMSGNASITGDTASLTLTDSSSHSANTGPAISFFSKDSGGTSREVAKIVGESHSGANEGNLALQTRNGGTLETKWKLFKNGNLIPTNSAYGIILGATATGDANLLDDYEEGSWTPTIQSTTGVSKTAAAANLGRYTKVGNQVTLTGTVAWDGTENLAGGLIGVGGFPFASVALGNYRSSAAMGASNQVNQPTSYQNGLAMSMDQNSSVCWVVARSTSSYTHYPVIGNTGGIYGINITYRTA